MLEEVVQVQVTKVEVRVLSFLKIETVDMHRPCFISVFLALF